MTDRIERMKRYILDKEHHVYRDHEKSRIITQLPEQMRSEQLSDFERSTKLFATIMKLETPVVRPDDNIVFMRTIEFAPSIFTDEEWDDIKSTCYVHELGRVCNICPDYASTIKFGLHSRQQQITNLLKEEYSPEEKGFLLAANGAIDSILDLTQRYQVEAARCGNYKIADILSRIPYQGAATFHEALQFFRILHFALWASGNYHNTIGRLDQFMMPYLEKDLNEGNLNKDEAYELLLEFFLSFNLDSDLYPGMQQGDNGQSLVLAGVNEEGKSAHNELTEMCLRASLELSMIDPKINMRLCTDTPFELINLGSELTKKGLGFPQYSNDEVVITGLQELGYELSDSRNYVVAACWEFIIPGKGMDIPNIGALSFAHTVNHAVKKSLLNCISFQELLCEVDIEIEKAIERETAKFKNLYFEPAPLLSIMMHDCIEKANDISSGNFYNNFGLHGTGLATAVDSLAAIKQFVYDDGVISEDLLLKALDSNFVGYEDLQTKLKYDAPKLGNDDELTNTLSSFLLDSFARHIKKHRNERGGIYRAGTGSAMYYSWHGESLEATADGRNKGGYLSANYSPSLNIKLNGPLKIIKSFAYPDLTKTINGGPLTIELHDSVFRNSESIQKVSWLVKLFMDMGGHQIQLNTINKDVLLKAKAKPDQYRNLIVRVWGWSGYFVELDPVYQDQIIQRAELSFTNNNSI